MSRNFPSHWANQCLHVAIRGQQPAGPITSEAAIFSIFLGNPPLNTCVHEECAHKEVLEFMLLFADNLDSLLESLEASWDECFVRVLKAFWKGNAGMQKIQCPAEKNPSQINVVFYRRTMQKFCMLDIFSQLLLLSAMWERSTRGVGNNFFFKKKEQKGKEDCSL